MIPNRTNTVEIIESLCFSEGNKIERVVKINGKQVYVEITDVTRDRYSTSNLKQFIDWLIGIEPRAILKKKVSFLESFGFKKRA
jgi:hypothetical protein